MLEHGGNLNEAVKLFGRARQDWLDLSTGINPVPYPVPTLDAGIWHRLPEPDPSLAAAAQAYCRAPLVLPVAGTRAAIQALPGLLERLADVLGPWTVSTVAQDIGRAALQDTAWQQTTRETLLERDERLRGTLLRVGIVSRGTALYQWRPEAQAQFLRRPMASQGVWVRLFTRGAGGIGCGLPPDEAGWRRLEQALQAWKEQIR